MIQLLKTGEGSNVPIQEWYVESESEIESIPNYTPAGSTVQILTLDGLIVKMKNSKGQWIDI